ncbi:hypothetical protein DOY81_012266, partial [Sarcophaga bullata]
VLDVPDKFLTERYQPISNDVRTRAGNDVEARVPVRDIRVPDLRIPMSLGREEQFSLFIPKHRAIAGRLIDIFVGVRNTDDLMSVAAYARDRVNPYLFNYAYRWLCCIVLITSDLIYRSSCPKFPGISLWFTSLSQVKLRILRKHNVRLATLYHASNVQYDGHIDWSGVQVGLPDGGQGQHMFNVLATNPIWTCPEAMGVFCQGKVVPAFRHGRIFIAPKFDETGQPMFLAVQRLLMVELDKFVASLNPGKNTIKRRSTESSVTIPFERTFRNLEENRPAEGSAQELEFNFCGCGWPQHMLIAKGLPEGLQCELFVMVSNYEQDRVDQELVGSCSDAASYCGVRDRKYPDKRAMGFPFDRLPRDGADVLAKFLTPNMAVLPVAIRHDANRIVQRPN